MKTKGNDFVGPLTFTCIENYLFHTFYYLIAIVSLVLMNPDYYVHFLTSNLFMDLDVKHCVGAQITFYYCIL